MPIRNILSNCNKYPTVFGRGKYRGFPVEGDSMPPHQDGDIIVGRYVERLGEVLDGKLYFNH
jgi:hypothetical protein